MISEQVIHSVNQLPPVAQQQVVDFVDFLTKKYQSCSNQPLNFVDNDHSQNKSQVSNVTGEPKDHIDLLSNDWKHGKNAGLEMFKVSKPLSLDDIDRAIAEGASEW